MYSNEYVAHSKPTEKCPIKVQWSISRAYYGLGIRNDESFEHSIVPQHIPGLTLTYINTMNAGLDDGRPILAYFPGQGVCVQLMSNDLESPT